MKKTAAIILLLILGHFAFAQQYLIKGSFDNFFVDMLGNYYTTDGSTLTKYDENGNETASFSNFTHGSIHWVDVSNPLKILVFYQEFDQIIYLDKTLSPSSDFINLSDYEISSATAVASSYDNGIWVYDQSEARLFRLGNRMEITHQSGPVSLKSELLHIEHTAHQAFLITKTEVLIFDRFANLIKTIPVQESHMISCMPADIYSVHDQQLIRFNLRSASEQITPLPDTHLKAIRCAKHQVYGLDNKGVFKITD